MDEDRKLDWEIGRRLERQDAEIERLRDAVWAAIPWLDDLQHMGSIVDQDRRAATLAKLNAAVRADGALTK